MHLADQHTINWDVGWHDGAGPRGHARIPDLIRPDLKKSREVLDIIPSGSWLFSDHERLPEQKEIARQAFTLGGLNLNPRAKKQDSPTLHRQRQFQRPGDIFLWRDVISNTIVRPHREPKALAQVDAAQDSQENPAQIICYPVRETNWIGPHFWLAERTCHHHHWRHRSSQ